MAMTVTAAAESLPEKVLATANSLIGQGKFTEASHLLEQADKTAGDATSAHLYNELAICYLELREYSKAEAALDASLRAVQGNANAIYLKGYVLFRTGHYEESQKFISVYLQNNPASVGARKLLGMDRYMLRNYPGALEELKRAIEMAPSDSESFYYLGRLYFSTDKAGDALEAFQSSIKNDPQNAKAWNHLGQTYEALNRMTDAERAYLKSMEVAREKNERYEWPFFNLGVLYTNNGRVRDGISYLRQALDINPSWSECKVKLSAALFSMGDIEAAIKLMSEAVSEDSENAEAHYRLAMMLTKSGHVAEAQQQLILFRQLQQRTSTQNPGQNR